MRIWCSTSLGTTGLEERVGRTFYCKWFIIYNEFQAQFLLSNFIFSPIFIGSLYGSMMSYKYISTYKYMKVLARKLL